MNYLAQLWRRVVLLVSRDRATRDLEIEMALHRELRAERLQSTGMSDVDARHAARHRFGSTLRVSEATRDTWGWGSADDVIQDLRYAGRRLRQRPGFALAVIVVLALGIGATTAMFSAVDASMLRPLPFERPNELVALNLSVPSSGSARPENQRTPDITDARRMTETFANVAAYAPGGLNLSFDDHPMRIRVGVVTKDFFATLGVAPFRGRTFDESEGRPGGTSSVILSWGLWQTQFGGKDITGATLPLNNRQYQIIGIMPRGFGFPDESDLWIPMTVPTTALTFEPFRGFLPSATFARVAPGIAVATANDRVIARWARYAAEFPGKPDPRYFNLPDMMTRFRANGVVHPLHATLVGDQKNALLVLLGATGLLLLIACANVTNLLLAYGASRRRELAVRSVLGATRGRVIRQLLSESVLLSTAGAAAGVGLAPIVLRMLRTLMPAALAGVAPARLDWRVLTFATGLGLLTGIVFGLWPAFGATRETAGATLKASGGHGASATGTRRTQRILVGAELALTVMLLVGAGLMLRSFEKLVHTDTGIVAENVGTLQLSFSDQSGPASSRMARIDAILQRLRETPGVTASGVVNDLPLRANGGIAKLIRTEGAPDTAEDTFSRLIEVSEGYFDAIGVPLTRGRLFDDRDNGTGPQVAIVNESMVHTYWPDVDPIGRRFMMGSDTTFTTVIGVVADVREGGLARPAGKQMFYPVRARAGTNIAVVARGTLPARTLLASMTSAVRSVDRAQAVYDVRTMADVIDQSVTPRRANTLLISLFGGLALAVSIFGVYAVTSYSVSQRTREFGIRAALGASHVDIVGHIAREMTWIAVGGIALGGALAWMLSRVLQSMIYGITVHDRRTFAAAPILLLLAVAVATLIPARRAMRVNPADVMRED